MRDRILDGLLDCTIWVILALKWTLIGIITVPFVWGWVVIVRAALGLVF